MKTLFLLVLMTAHLTAEAASSSGKDQRSNGAYFEETFFPVYVMKNDTESQAGGSATKDVPTQTGWGIDARTTLGYVWTGVLLGLTYNHYHVNSSRPLTVDYEGLNETTDKSEWGVTLGYMAGHVRIAGTYFFNATKTFAQKYTDPATGNVSTDETRKNTDGTGHQIALGYDFQLGAGWGISPTLIYKTISYAKQSYVVRTGSGTPYGKTRLQTKAVDSEIKPMITLSYVF